MKNKITLVLAASLALFVSSNLSAHHGGPHFGGWGFGGHHHVGSGLWWTHSYGYSYWPYSSYTSPFNTTTYPYGYFSDDDDDDDDDMPKVGYWRGVRGPSYPRVVYPPRGTSFYPVGSPVTTAFPEDGCDSLGFNGCQVFGNACKWDGLNRMCTVR